MTKLEYKEIPKPLLRLIAEVADLPDNIRAKLASALDATVEDTMSRRDLLYQIRTSLETLRTQITYLIFDLEATRRERDEALKKCSD